MEPQQRVLAQRSCQVSVPFRSAPEIASDFLRLFADRRDLLGPFRPVLTQSVLTFVNRLIGLDSTLADDSQEALAKSKLDLSRQTTPTEPRSLYIELALHPKDVDRVLAAAPSEAIRDAWRKGKAVPEARHVLKIVMHDIHESADQEPGSDEKAMQARYDEVRHWWEQR